MVNRRGSVLDILFVAVILLGVVIAVTMAQTVVDEFQDAQKNTSIDTRYMDKAETALGVFDAGIVILMVAMYLFSIILAARIAANPVFFIPALIMLLLSTWVSAEFANVWWQFVNVGDPVTAASNQFPLLTEAMKNLPFIQFAFGSLIMIVQFTRIGSAAGRAQR